MIKRLIILLIAGTFIFAGCAKKAEQEAPAAEPAVEETTEPAAESAVEEETAEPAQESVEDQ